MPTSPVPTNLSDMIELIAADKLQEEIFSLHAPSLSVCWAALPTKRKARAKALAELLVDFMKSDVGKHQGRDLFRQISTIAIINADTSNSAPISDQINDHVELKNRLNEPEWLCIPKKGTAVLAAFINILAHRTPKPTGDEMKDKHNNQARDVASRVWRDLIASATSQLNNVKHTPRSSVTMPTIVNEDDRAAGISAFCNEFKRLIREKRDQDRFYVAVAPIPSEYKVRYLIKTSPLAGEVMAVNEDHSDTNLEPNRHVIAIEILYDDMHNSISISKTKILPEKTILGVFMKLVLGSEFAPKQKLCYAECLQKFRGKAGERSLTLPKANLDHGDRVWISSISVSLDGNLLPTTYRGDEMQNIYQQMDRQIDPKVFPEDKRVVEEIVIKVLLHDTKGLDDGNTLVSSNTKTFTIKVAEKTFTIYGKEKCYNNDWLNLLRRLQNDWGLKGLTLEQAALGKEPIGDLLPGI